MLQPRRGGPGPAHPERAGLAEPSSVEQADIRQALADGRPSSLVDDIDLSLLAHSIYYLPVDERVELLRAVARLLAPGGELVIVSTMAGPQLFSRHLGLELRAQDGRMELPTVDALLGQIREAGLQAYPPERIGPFRCAGAVIRRLRTAQRE